MQEPQKKSNIRVKAAILWLLSAPFWILAFLSQIMVLPADDYDWAMVVFCIFMVPIFFLRCESCKTSSNSILFGPAGQGGPIEQLKEEWRLLTGKHCPKCGIERK